MNSKVLTFQEKHGMTRKQYEKREMLVLGSLLLGLSLIVGVVQGQYGLFMNQLYSINAPVKNTDKDTGKLSK